MKPRGGNSIEQANESTALVPVRPSRAPAPTSQRAGAHLDITPAREWMTAAEASAEALPGFSFDERHIRRFLAEGHIATRPRQSGIGRKGREFHWTALPREARAEYLKRHGITEIAAVATNKPAARETEKDLRAETRKKIADAAAAYVGRSKRTKSQALQAFAELYRNRRLRGFEAIDYELEPTADPDQVRTWDRTIRVKGAGALIDGRGRPKGTSFFDKADNLEARNYVIAAVSANGKITAGDLCGDLERDTGRTVAKRTMQTFLATIRQANPALRAAVQN